MIYNNKLPGGTLRENPPLVENPNSELLPIVLNDFQCFPKPLAKLYCTVFLCSPYLGRLIKLESEWIIKNLDVPINVIFFNLLQEINSTNSDPLTIQCRLIKRKVSLLIALADLGRIWSLNNVSKALTIFADKVLSNLLLVLIKEENFNTCVPKKSNKLLKYNDNSVFKSNNLGLFVLAMGKMGSFELNYSSDIDLIFFYNPSKAIGGTEDQTKSIAVKVVRKLVKLLSSFSSHGYIFRTDLRLRPDPASTSIVLATDFATNYYIGLGRTWERMAYIKARAVGGDKKSGTSFLKGIESFVWRKQFDYAAVEDVRALRDKIKKLSNSGNSISLSGHNIKLGRGGIRELEFFVQTHQLIAGGRDKGLRKANTTAALKILSRRNWVEPSTAKKLELAYVFLRELEHRLQMIDDTQTQTIPKIDEARFSQLCCLSGEQCSSVFSKKILIHLSFVDQTLAKFFDSLEFRKSSPSVEQYFSEKSIIANDLKQVVTTIADWNNLPSFKSEKAKDLLLAIQPKILSIIRAQNSGANAVQALDRFFRSLPSVVQLLSMFNANKEIIKVLITLCELAPPISDFLSRNPELFDLVLYKSVILKEERKLFKKSEVSALLKRVNDYESSLNLVRKWLKEKKFLIAFELIQCNISSRQAGHLFSKLAEICLSVIWPIVLKHFEKRHGHTPGLGASILAMGRLASKEMNISSDLDLIVIYKSEINKTQTHELNISEQVYFSKLTQALVSAISVLTEEGRLYKVDMRLRPSGRQGPVATSTSSFSRYQNEKAWVWEHLALSRGRMIVGDRVLVGSLNKMIFSILSNHRHSNNKIRLEVSQMRTRLAENKLNNSSELISKHGPGGLQDLELMIQMGILLFKISRPLVGHAPGASIKPLMKVGFFSSVEALKLNELYRINSILQQLSQLLFDPRTKGSKLSSSGITILNTLLKKEKVDFSFKTEPELISGLEIRMREAAKIFNRKLRIV